MLRIRYFDRNESREWKDAYLVNTISDRQAGNGVRLLCARECSGRSWGETEGLEMFVIDSVNDVRIARRMIPMLDLEEAK